MAEVAYLSASVVEEGNSKTISQFPRGRLSMMLAREVCVNVRKVKEYQRMSRDLRRSVRRLSVSIDQLRALGDYGDENESLNLLNIFVRRMWKSCSFTPNDEGDAVKDHRDRKVYHESWGNNFVNELEVLVGKLVPEKMCEFLKANQEKDMPNIMKLWILGREFELRDYEKNLFIKRLNGIVRF
nr:hypothetical protein [Tanacetum cinerariifolium]